MNGTGRQNQVVIQSQLYGGDRCDKKEFDTSTHYPLSSVNCHLSTKNMLAVRNQKEVGFFNNCSILLVHFTPKHHCMQEIIINLLSGAAGGNAAGGLLKKLNMGPIWNTITGLIGGAGGGQLLNLLNTGGGTDANSIITQVLSGLGGGAILTAIVGFIKKQFAK